MFCGFDGILVAKNLRATAPGSKKITYDQFLRFLSLWFSGVMGVSAPAFRKQLPRNPEGAVAASAASNAAVLAELWGHRGGWITCEAQKRYIKSDTTRCFSVSRVAKGPPKTPAPYVRIECDAAEAPPELAEEEQTPDMVGVPSSASAWP